MNIACTVKIKNLTGGFIVVNEKVIPPGKFAYFDKEDLLEDTNVYRWQMEGKVEIEEISADKMQSLDLIDELDGYKFSTYDNNKNIVHIDVYYDPGRTHLWYTMDVDYNENDMPTFIDEKFYYYDGSLMFERKRQYTYDPNTGMPIGEIPIHN